MLEFEDLEYKEQEKIIQEGLDWMHEHMKHVDSLTFDGEKTVYPPSGSDLYRPSLWKPAHWRWFYITWSKYLLDI